MLTAPLRDARRAYEARSWAAAYGLFARAEAEEPLSAADLDEFAVTAMLLNRMEDFFRLREQAYDLQRRAGDLAGAAESALWIGTQRMVHGEAGLGGGWLARAADLVAEDGTDSVAAGVLLLGRSFGAHAAGRLEEAITLTRTAVETGRRLGDEDLTGLALHQCGQFLLEAGNREEGLARLDEAMVLLSAGRLSPLVTGIVYCGAIAGCWRVYELRRAQEWTAAMTDWCDQQPDLANFAGECKVRRAELKQLRGAWHEAREELSGVADTNADRSAVAAAAYARGNLDRLQGDYDSAEDAFAASARLGFEPQPGLALLRLARGHAESAAAAIRRCLAERHEVGKRVELLFAAVEILLAVHDTSGAVAAMEELGRLSHWQDSPIVGALQAQAEAAILLAEGKPGEALPRLRAALDTWIRFRVPYEEARTRVLIGDACNALGDADSAGAEKEIARRILGELSARPGLTPVEGVLTPRELEVLRLVATGATNKAIAERLVLSERTVDRHVSNIFSKIGASTRSGATAYAYERRLA